MIMNKTIRMPMSKSYFQAVPTRATLEYQQLDQFPKKLFHCFRLQERNRPAERMSSCR